MKTITMTAKGQVTLPVEAQRLLGLKPSDKLAVTVDQTSRRITLERPMTLDEFTTLATSVPRKKTKPVTGVSNYYAKHREVRR